MTPREKEHTEQLAAARQEISLLRQKIDSLVRRVFGSSSERLDRAQLELLLQLPVPATPDPAATVVVAPKATVSHARKDRTPRLPENLPVVEEVIEPEPVKAQPEQWRCIGQEVANNWITNRPAFCAAAPSAKNMFPALRRPLPR